MSKRNSARLKNRKGLWMSVMIGELWIHIWFLIVCSCVCGSAFKQQLRVSFSSSVWSKAAGEARDRAQHLAGGTAGARCICLLCFVSMASAESNCVHKSPPPSTRRARQLSAIMGMREALMVGCWSMNPLERNVKGVGVGGRCGRTGEDG